MGKWPTFRVFGDHGVLIQWQNEIDESVHSRVLEMERFILKTYPNMVIETVPTYQALAVYLKTKMSPISFIDELQINEASVYKTLSEEKEIITIPVCYHPEYAIDIAEIAVNCNLSPDEIVKLHTTPIYKVYFLGFLPGFPYLGGMDARIGAPRKNTPRTYIPAGSIGIGGNQTGIYTFDSPGGWNIIGKTPLTFFSMENAPMTLLKAGDFVKFRAVSRRGYAKIEIAIKTGSYSIEREVSYD